MLLNLINSDLIVLSCGNIVKEKANIVDLP